MKDVCKGKWQMVMISPELILSKRFVKYVLRNSELIPRILSIVVDEAHVVSHCGSGFRKKYGSLGILRALVPKGTPFVAMSETLSDRVRKDVLSKLQFKTGTFLDRPNVSLVVHAIQNPMNVFSDLDFLIAACTTDPQQIKQAFIYADQVSSADGMEKRLYSIAPESFREAGIIRPYSAAYSVEYRMEVMALFKAKLCVS